MPGQHGDLGYFTSKNMEVAHGTNSMDLAAAFQAHNPTKDYLVLNTSSGSRVIELDERIQPAGKDARHLNLG